MNTIPGRRVILALFLVFLLLPIYWLVNMSFKTNDEISRRMTPVAAAAHARQLPRHLHRPEPGTPATSTR